VALLNPPFADLFHTLPEYLPAETFFVGQRVAAPLGNPLDFLPASICKKTALQCKAAQAKQVKADRRRAQSENCCRVAFELMRCFRIYVF
jgi:hypothetical protein